METAFVICICRDRFHCVPTSNNDCAHPVALISLAEHSTLTL